MKFAAQYKGNGAMPDSMPKGASGKVVSSRSAFSVQGVKLAIVANNVQEIHKVFGKVKVRRLQKVNGKTIDIQDYIL